MQRKKLHNIDDEEFKIELDTEVGPPKKSDQAKDKTAMYKFPEGVNLQPYQDRYLLRHFTMLVVGKPGSGKTSAIRTLLTDKDYYLHKFDNVFIMSPSATKMGIHVKKDCMSQQFDLKWIETKLFEINRKQVQAIAARLKELNIIEKFDIERLNGHLFDTVTTDLSRAANPGTREQIMPNLFADKERFFSKSVKKQMDASTVPTKTITRKKPLGKGQAPLQEPQVDLATYVDTMYQTYYMKLPQEERQRFYRNCLIIFDDMISQIKANEGNPLLTQLIFNRRHLILGGCVSVMIVAQKYTMIPARVRSNANWLLLFRLNAVDFETVFKDAVILTHDDWHALLEFVFAGVEKKYNNIGIWVEQDEYFMNFQRLKLNNQHNFIK